MKKMSIIALLASTLTLGTPFSQTESKAGMTVAAVGQLPINGFSDNGAGLGVGGMGGLEAGMYPGLAVTVRSGYIYHFANNNITYFHQVPILGGLKFTVPQAPLYIAGELGAVLTKTDFGSTLFTPAHTASNTRFGWDAGLGSMVGPVDLRLTFNVLDASNMTNFTTIGLSVGVSTFNM